MKDLNDTAQSAECEAVLERVGMYSVVVLVSREMFMWEGEICTVCMYIHSYRAARLTAMTKNVLGFYVYGYISFQKWRNNTTNN